MTGTQARPRLRAWMVLTVLAVAVLVFAAMSVKVVPVARSSMTRTWIIGRSR